jgi:hypothetical protein
MSDKNNNNMKIELFRADSDNKLKIRVHLSKRSSNVIIDNDELYWMPNYEDLNLLIDAFNLVPVEKKVISPRNLDDIPHKKNDSVVEEKKPEKQSTENLETELEIPLKKQLESNLSKDISNEKHDESVVFQSADEEISKSEKLPPKAIEGKDLMEAKIKINKGKKQNEHISDKSNHRYEELFLDSDKNSLDFIIEKNNKKNADSSIINNDDKHKVEKVISKKKRIKLGRFR